MHTEDLFGDENFDWQKEWQGMPEFVQENLQEIHSITVHFVTVEDMKLFSELVGKNITFTTKSMLFPVTKTEKMVWVDES
tara:strand:+ start:250 stop:489 length:240 start_codon:yes stop_codon:yes gene_type:complete